MPQLRLLESIPVDRPRIASRIRRFAFGQEVVGGLREYLAEIPNLGGSLRRTILEFV